MTSQGSNESNEFTISKLLLHWSSQKIIVINNKIIKIIIIMSNLECPLGGYLVRFKMAEVYMIFVFFFFVTMIIFSKTELFWLISFTSCVSVARSYKGNK